MRIFILLVCIFCGSRFALVAAPGVYPGVFAEAIQVNNDTLPVVGCPPDTLLFPEPSGCTVVLDYTVTASDDTPGWTLTQTGGLAAGAEFPVGKTINQFVVTDVDGNSAACSFAVSVIDTTPPVALCAQNVAVTLSGDDPNDCFFGAVGWLPVSALDAGSYDNCGGQVLLTVQRRSPYSDCINGLNFLNGRPDCNDLFPDFPSEFEVSATEQDSVKLYCCERGAEPVLQLRAYQLDASGHLALGPGNQPIFSACTPTVVVQSPDCPPLPYQLVGVIDLDTNQDCVVDNTQFNIPSMPVQAVAPNGTTLYATSDAMGYFSFGVVDSGDFTVTFYPPAPAWQVCNNPMTLSPVQGTPVFGQAVSAQIETGCPVLLTDLSSAAMRPCSTSVMHIRSCDVGGTAAVGAYVQVTVDPLLTVTGVSLPYTQDGHVVTVNLGTINPGACVDFAIFVQVSCDPSATGQVVCNEAHIYPDSICLPLVQTWSGAQIEAQAECVGDSVRFTLQNTGAGPTSAPLDYIVIDDMVIMLQGQLPAGFGPGAERREILPVNGHTLRLMAEQEPNHPISVPPSVAVEHCNGSTDPGLLLVFPNESGSPFTDKDCRQIRNSLDPNEKLAFPLGYSDDHLIEPNTRIEYQLNFQNTGTDTAFTVVLRDTLSPLLNPASIRMGAASHPYTWSLEDQGTLVVRFDSILLPDSNANEPASHGFVQFEIAQKANNPIGSVLDNRAGIYFDQNPVVLTNTVFHTVGNNFIPSATIEPAGAGHLQVYPNPATETMFLPLEASANARLTDLMGNVLRQYDVRPPGLVIRRDGLPKGVYFVEIRGKDGQVRTCLAVWK